MANEKKRNLDFVHVLKDLPVNQFESVWIGDYIYLQRVFNRC